MYDELLPLITQQFLPTLIALIVGLLLHQLIQALNLYVPELLKILKEWAGDRTYSQIQSIVKAGVLAAEQAGLTGHILNEGRQKKQAALDYIKGELIRLKLDGFIPIDVIDKMIEATVYKELEHVRFYDLTENVTKPEGE